MNTMNAHEKVESEIKNQLGHGYWKTSKPETINQGDCGDFSNDVINRLLGPIWTASGPGHIFIAARDGKVKYFDSECPHGVRDPRSLPFYQRNGFGDYAWIRRGWIPMSGGSIIPMPDEYCRHGRAYDVTRVIGSKGFMECFMSYPLSKTTPIKEIQYF